MARKKPELPEGTILTFDQMKGALTVQATLTTRAQVEALTSKMEALAQALPEATSRRKPSKKSSRQTGSRTSAPSNSPEAPH